MMQALEAVFERNFSERQELGASVAVYQKGKRLASLARGWCERAHERTWDESTLVPVYSATKGPAAATLLCALEEAGLSPATPVRKVWTDFPVDADFAQLLSHRTGLVALDESVSVFDHEAVVTAIEAQKPAWGQAVAHGYHARTFGALLDQPVRLLTGMSLGDYWRKRIADPLGLEFWMGLPEELEPRVASLYPGKMDKSDMEDSAFYQAFLERGTLTQRTFASPKGLHSVAEMNTRQAHAACLPAMGGIGTAIALAEFYQAMLGTPLNGVEVISDQVREWASVRQIQGFDQVMRLETAFHMGFMTDPVDASGKKMRCLYGPNFRSFGHPGSGGSHAFADPETGISFAYTMNQMELSLFPGPKSLDLIEALYREI